MVTNLGVLLKTYTHPFLINRTRQREHPEIKGSQIVVKVVQGGETSSPQWEIIILPAGSFRFTEK